MGAWGTGIFDDDLALDIKADFEDALDNGLTIDAATQQILEEYAEVLEDEDEGPIIYFALAALQLEQGEIQQIIKSKALHIISTGESLDLWEEAGQDALAKRQQALLELKTKLLNS
jgi:hypothetical protein